MAEIRNFVLREKNGKEDGVFTGHQPRQAALKAANHSKGTKSKPVELRLKEAPKKFIFSKAGQKSLQPQRTSQNGCQQRSISRM